jgi:putative ABC transport system permease protein
MGTGNAMRDLRQAVRGLLRAPTYAVASVLTLGLGIGATTAIFSVVHAVLLRSLPYDEPGRIIRAWDHTRDGEITDFTFRVVEYRELRTRTQTFEAVGAEFPISATVSFDGLEPQQVQGRMVTSDLFRVFGVEPGLGRMFTLEEVDASDRLLAVVSHGFWLRYLGADPDAVGRTMSVDGRAYTVLGVLPEGYVHVSGSDAQLFIPYTIGTSGWIAHWLEIYGRLRPGVSLERAEEEVNSALRAVAGSDRRGDRWFATVESLHDMVVGDVRTPMWAVFGVVALVLLLACVNVANLTLARSTSRRHEVALRRSLGASRGRLLRHLLAENLVVAAAGGALGVLMAWASLGLLLRLAPPSIPRIGETRVDLIVLAFSLVVSVATALVFGLGPALRMTRASTGAESLRSGRGETGARSFHRLLGGLVVSEVALALTLLVSAGLTVRTLQHLQGEDLGFDRSGTLTFRINVPPARYPGAANSHAFYTRLREELGALPGVVAVGAGTDLPVSGEGAVATVTSEERFRAGSEEGVTVLQRRATQGLFEALGTPILHGRGFDVRDRGDGDAVVIISESLSRALYGDENPVGRRIGWGNIPEAHDWMTIVGVVGDVRYETIERISDPQLYQAHAQSAAREMAVVIRTEGDPMGMLEPARTVLESLDPQIPIYSAGTLGGLVDIALAGRRFTATLFGLFALVALALTVAGLYGVLAFAVGQRRREIGVRMAIGASGFGVARQVLGRGLTLIGLGLVGGFVGALAAGRLLGGLLVGVPAFDPATFGVVGVVLLGVGVAACLAPALGASRVDPMEALREQ